MTETCHLLLKRIGPHAETAFLNGYTEGAFELLELRKDHCARLTELMEAYADLPMDLADASLVLLAEQFGHERILSTDQRDLRTCRWTQRRPFQNLLLVEE